MAEGDDTRISDETLLGRTAAGDRSAFERLVRRHQASVHRFARALAYDDADAEQALQETFLAAWRVAGRFRYDASARTWLLAIARHAIYRRHRRWADEPAGFASLRELGEAAGWGREDEAFVDRLVDGERFGSEFSAAVFALREILREPARDEEAEARLLARLRAEIG